MFLKKNLQSTSNTRKRILTIITVVSFLFKLRKWYKIYERIDNFCQAMTSMSLVDFVVNILNGGYPIFYSRFNLRRA